MVTKNRFYIGLTDATVVIGLLCYNHGLWRYKINPMLINR